MPQSLTLPTIGILSLGAVGLGMHLGNMSIAEINPIYFQPAPTRFHSDLSANRPDFESYAPRIDAAVPMELGTGCIGCRTNPEEYVPEREPAIDGSYGASPAEQAPVQLAAAAPPADADMIRREAELERLSRYSRFAVSADERQEVAFAPEVPATADGEATAIQGDEMAVTQ